MSITDAHPARLAADTVGQRYGTFSYLPAMAPDRLRRQIEHLVDRDLDPAIEHTAPDAARRRFWRMWQLPFFGERDADAVVAAIDACKAAYPDHVIRLIGYDKLRQTQAAAFVVHEPADV